MKCRFLLLLFLSGLLPCRAQKGALDLSFNPGAGLAGGAATAYAVALQPDGKIIIGGQFYTYNGDITNEMVRLLPDGTLDTTFHVIVNLEWEIRAITMQSDGKILAGGFFDTFDLAPAKFLVRLNNDGSLDTTFHTGTGFNNIVRRVVIQPDGRILVGGVFTSYNNQYCGRLMRLNTDGTADTTFNTTPGANGTVECIVIQPDNKIVIAGDFDSYNNDTLFRIARLNTDGSEDPSYDYQFGGADKVIYGMALESDTGVIIAGHFTSFTLQARPSVAEINRYGNLTGFQNSLGANNEVDDVQIAGADQVLISGAFSSYGGFAFNGIASMNASGLPDTTFHSGADANAWIFKMVIQPDGKIIIVGSFTTYNGVSRNGIARLYNCNTPQPGPIAGDTAFSCPGVTLTYSIDSVYGASNYTWTLPAGWQGSSDSTSIHVIASDTGGVISVVAFGDSCGNSVPQMLTVQRMATLGQPVCLVTVDSQSVYNIIIWEKPQTRAIDSFFIYRQDSTYIFTKIAAAPYSSFSEYDDTASAANPNSTAHQYKISILDTCGTESVLSDYHSTIFLQYLGNGNLSWAPYEIENAVNPVIYYRIYRDTAGNGIFAPLNTIIPGGNTSYTDVDAALYPLADYVLDVFWGIGCSPSRSVNTTRSNIKGGKKSLEDGIFATAGLQQLQLYPNPANNFVNIICPAPGFVQSVEVFDLLGKFAIINTFGEQGPLGSYHLNLHDVAKGVYTVKVKTGLGIVFKKLVIQ
jgi:uncharacterized delta-60 repeat protein